MLRRLVLVALLALLATFGLGSSTALASSCAVQPQVGAAATTHYDTTHFFGSQKLDCGTRNIATIHWRVQFLTTDGIWVGAWQSYQDKSYATGVSVHATTLGDTGATGCGTSNLHIYAMRWQIDVTFQSGTFPNSFDYTQNDTNYNNCDRLNAIW